MWKPVLEISGLYEVSDDGAVRSTTRIILDKQNHQYLHHGKDVLLNQTWKGIF